MGLTARIRTADDPEVERCLSLYYEELDRRFDTGFDVELTPQADIEETTPPRGVFLTVQHRSDGDTDPALGIGALRLEQPGVAEMKRMWVSPEARGMGAGRLLVESLEAAAVEFGYREVWLDSNSTLTEAISLYRSMGYTDIARYNTHPFAHVWLGKTLP
ncbi:MAG: GNAT family N-acetyltransferase [Actinomycetia bacterium]|nr:GNAT family N-acetyltransferase [Actinomycetes bacterium]MCP4960077.1 GNAT family N-acetyltransferase [Actinomycetes bacterium]